LPLLLSLFKESKKLLDLIIEACKNVRKITHTQKQKMKIQLINKTLQDAFGGDLERRLSVPWEHLEAFVF
jgi:hypothetical protein